MRRLLAAVLISGGMLTFPAQAWADGYVAPFFGVNFGGDTTKNSTTFGGSLGFLGKTAGFEVDFGYTPDFFGNDSLDVDGKTATVMGNVLIGGRHHGASPYIALGAGLIRTNLDDPTHVFNETKNNWGGNIGGGVFIGSGKVTFRGDVRYFKSFDTTSDFPEITGEKLGFWRATAGIGLMW
jgi:Outer membrane protein beta-barrel domain